MNKEDNLIPKDLSKRPDHIALSIKGGKAKSKAKTLANTIKGLKTASDSKKQEHFNRLLRDPDYSILELIQFAEKIKVYGKDNIALLNAKTKLHQATHGTKQNIAVTGQLDVISTVKQWLKPKNTSSTSGDSSKASSTLPTQDKPSSITVVPGSNSSLVEDDGVKR